MCMKDCIRLVGGRADPSDHIEQVHHQHRGGSFQNGGRLNDPDDHEEGIDVHVHRE